MPESGDVVGALMQRVNLVRAESEHLVSRSAILVTARRVVARLLPAGVWVPEDEVPEFVGHLLDERTTRGICERCTERLQRDGESRPITR